MSSPQTTTSDLGAVAAALREHDRFLVTTHENPDGDALGSLLATTLMLEELGKDAVMYLYGDAPIPTEYQFMELERLTRAFPEDAAERVLVAVDCANEDRIGHDLDLVRGAPLTINIDHHHDNTRFGELNLIVSGASSTGEVLRDVLQELDLPLTPEIAEALYIALVTDTGRFQYANTTPKALRLAAELVDAGADVHSIFQQVYESVQFQKLKLLARALERAQVYERRAHRRLVSPAHGLQRAERARPVLGGDHRLPAGGRGRRHGGTHPRAASAFRARAADQPPRFDGRARPSRSA